ncbi:MAG: hypothetical protein IPF67_03550 [Saprospiraceae bacterium]|nr:hypothetical protein [Candidatus Brachybacter algidus]
MKQRRFFKNGEPNGIVTDWYENSAKKTVTIYLGGKKNGVSNRYYENGNLKQKIQYRNDMANGLVNFYDSLGNIQSSFVYKNGEVEKTLLESNVKSFQPCKGDIHQRGTKCLAIC